MNVVDDVEAIATLVAEEPVPMPAVDIVGPDAVASSAYDVDRLLAASAAYAVSAMERFGTAPRSDSSVHTIDLEHLLAYCTTHVTVDGDTVPAWADLSGVYQTSDGRHLQIHCNFDHHAAGVVERLGCEPSRESVAAAIAGRAAFELEQQLIDDGMIGAVVRTLDEWAQHPHASATADLPVVSTTRIDDAPPRATTIHDAGVSPLDGVKVLDCSRVLAGPVAGQLLADHGADVLRLGAAHLPSIPVGVIATGFGKRNAFADITSESGRAVLWELIDEADVWIDAYRPGAFADHGFTPHAVAAARPGIVIVQLSAFDWVGPWAGRRGFDSIVQSTTGVRDAGGRFAVDTFGEPTASGPVGLPVQALDYATGFLAAGAAADLLSRQRADGGSWLARLSLLRTRNWLVGMSDPTPFTPAPVTVDERFVGTATSDFGTIEAVRPFAGSWRSAPRPLGSSAPRWGR